MKSLKFKKIYLFFSSVIIFLMHMPIVFSKSKNISHIFSTGNAVAATTISDTLTEVNGNVRISNIYDSLKLGSIGLGRKVFDYAMKGFGFIKEKGYIDNANIISIVDFSKPSSQKRLFIIDLKNYKVLFNTYVAHGMQSGKEFAEEFSNTPSSNKSSLGFYETLGTYMGGNGYSLRLQGLERGINDNANRRDIVMHGAAYVNEKLIHSQGYIGRSWGCPAVPPKLHKPIIDKIKNGTCLFIYSPDKKYLSHSRILNGIETPSFALN